jgi:DNA helicase-2/ATP-dependent DNA helicase PcrA
MDFEDLLLNTLLLFKNNKNILNFYQEKFQYILIDEYQDTNYIQFQILKELSLKSEKICGVGDDYQSIYSFRGATLSNISNFIKTFPNVTIFKLCQNYRSNSNIVKVSNQLIKHNENQQPKDLFSQKEETDGKVTFNRK